MNRHVLEGICGIALLSFMDAAIKALVERLPVVEIACLRYAIASVVMLLLAWLTRSGWPSRETIRANAVRAIVVVITAVTFFYALGQLPLAETLVLSFVSPIFTALFAALLLGERADRRIALAIVAGFGGVLIIVIGGAFQHGASADPAQAGSTPLLGIAAVLVSAVTYSASNVLLRARAQRDPVLMIVLIQNVAPCLILAVPTAIVWTPPSRDLWAMIGAVGLLGVGGHLMLARAYAGAEATRLAPLDYTALIWAALIGFAVFGEVPSIWVGFGGLMILLATGLASRR